MIDATATVELVLMTEIGIRVGGRIFGSGESVHGPELLDLEVAQVLRRMVIRGSVDPKRASRAFSDVLDLEIRRHSHDSLRTRVWQLRESFSAYDAAYVALAESLNASLLTYDQRLTRSAAQLVQIESI